MTVALIFGAAVWPEGPSPTLRRRTRHAARLWHAGKVSHLIPCGGIGAHPPSEAEAMRRLLLADGVPESAITLEDRSTTTLENVSYALPILEHLGTNEVLVVTDRLHAPRALMTARAFGLQARASSPSLRGAHPGQSLRMALRELPACVLYGWKLHRLRRRG